MITALLLTSLTLAPAAEMPSVLQQAPVKVWLNKRGDLERGDRVRVYTRADADGYLLILHAEPDGRIRVLFPVDPLNDNYVRGGREYEIRGRGDRETFRIYENSGVGTVYAAFSRDPFRTDAFVRADHWDYRVLEQWRLNEDLDPESELTALVQEMAGGVGFSYDLTHYVVGERVAASYYSGGYPRSYVNVSLGHGWWDPWWGVSVGWNSWYDPYWYGPSWWYPYRYRPYRWAYYYYPYSGYYYDYPYSGYYYDAYRYRYPAGTYYAGNGNVRGRYVWKSADRYDLARGGIISRSRLAQGLQANAGLRSTLPSRVGNQLSGRRTSPAVQQVTDRRVAPTADRVSGRRTVENAQSGTRRVAPAQETSGRRVQPAGWGITDGRRVIPSTERRGEPASETPQSGRRATPSTQPETGPRRPDTPATTRRPATETGTTERRQTPSAKPETPARRTETPATRRPVQKTRTPARTTVERRPTTVVPARPSAERGSHTTPKLERRTPARTPTTRRVSPSATPRTTTPRPSAPRKAAPRPSSSSRPTARPAPSRPAPRPAVRSAPRPAARSAPRPAPRPAARPAPRRAPSRPAARPAPARTPTRSSPARSSPTRRKKG